MHITQWGEYGVHCCAYLAKRHAQGVATVPASEIAESQQLPLDYAQQILQRLRRTELVKSVRGPQGGYALGRPANEITLYDILLAAEGDTFEVICDNKPIGQARCEPNGDCNLRPVWRALREHVNEFLGKHSLQDLIVRSGATPNDPIQINQHKKTVEMQ